MERWTPTAGTPQGAVISPLLANIYCTRWTSGWRQQGYRMVRYADDFVVLCRAAEEAASRAWRDQALGGERTACGCNPDKTHVGDCRQAGRRLRVPRLPVRGGTAMGAEEEPRSASDEHPGQDRTDARGEPGAGHRRPEPDAAEAGSATSSTPIRRLPSDWTASSDDRLRAILRKQDKRPGFGR